MPVIGIDTLSKVPLFNGLKPADLEQVSRSGRIRQFESDSYLFMEADPAEVFYVLLKGRVKLTQTTPEGQLIILHYSTAGEPFGIVGALGESVYPVSAQAVEDSQVLAWDRATMREVMLRYPVVALNALQILANRTREFQDRVRELSTEKVERRIARALLRLAHQTGRKTEEGVLIDMALSRQDLAQLTGTTLFTVSRTLSHWESMGLIKSAREQVIIRFPHGLVTIAEDLPLPQRRNEA